LPFESERSRGAPYGARAGYDYNAPLAAAWTNAALRP
jgi:hypothetical protein